MKNFNLKVQSRFAEMAATGKLFRVQMTGQEVWDKYLESFEDGDDPMFRDPNSTTHNCNFCNNFIRRYGNIVAIDENFRLMTLFDFHIDGEFENVAKELSKAIKLSEVVSVFFETVGELNDLPYEKKVNKTQAVYRLGIASNPKRYTRQEAEAYNQIGTDIEGAPIFKPMKEWAVKPNQVITFDHIFLDLPKAFVNMSGKSAASINAEYVSAGEVFLRAMEEIPAETLQLVIDLIVQSSITSAESHLPKLREILKLKKIYDSLTDDQRTNWSWITSYGFVYAKFRSELIGTLCVEIAEGKELVKACLDFNKRNDPANYMKAVAPYTEAQKKRAIKLLKELELEPSFVRRLATIDDIKVSEILHINSGKGEIKEISILDGLSAPSHQHKRNQFDGIEEVSIDKFMSDILPGCTSVEAYLTNKLRGNMVTMTTATSEDAKPIFKYGNNYSRTFAGNLAGKSMIKEAVKSQGGKVDCALRFSIMWAEDSIDNSDLDAHAQEKKGSMKHTIYYSNKGRPSPVTGGILDIDITQPQYHKKQTNKDVVENIAYADLEKLKGSTITFLINQFSGRSSQGFKAEIEFDGQLFSYASTSPVRGKPSIATVKCDMNGEFSIEHHREVVAGETASVELYGLQTNQFHKVNLACLSPNHWGDTAVGNKYFMFMLDKCKAPGPVRTFHNEDLIPELKDVRGVLDVLGDTVSVESTDGQLSGVGFNATVRDELIVKLAGSHKRTVKIKF